MGFATHLGPWGTGTVKDTTGTTPGTIRNVGLMVLSQSATLATTPGFAAIAVLPAGSQILNVYADTTTVFGAATTITIGDGTTANKYVTSTTITTAARHDLSANLVVADAVNIGTSDVVVSATLGGSAVTGEATITVVYVQKASNGAANPASA